MTTLVIFALEGVLQSESGRPIDAGCRLYRTMRNSLACQAGIISSLEEAPVRRFFDQQHMAVPAFIHWSVPQHPEDWENTCRLIRRAYPYEIDWIITPDPDIAAVLYYEGFRTMLWTDPRYSRPEWRPDARPHAASSWNKLADGLREDRELISNDDRIT